MLVCSAIRVPFTDDDIAAIVGICCLLPHGRNFHLTYPSLQLTQQLRILRKLRFDAPHLSELRRLLALFEDQVCQALATELCEIGVLTEHGIDMEVLTKKFLIDLSTLQRLDD